MNENKNSDVLELIIEAAKHNNEISQFGERVAEILKDNKLIDKADFDVLTGK